jgi:hypothetical protein
MEPLGGLSKSFSDESVEREWARAAENEGCETREVEEVGLVAGRAELWASGGDG